MLRLQDIKKIKKELAEFEYCISCVQNQKRKQEFIHLLTELKNELKLIDDNHSTEYNGYIKPKMIRENIEKMSKIRSKLYQLKKDIS
jgi:predicted transposase YbfD/YdcC